ncbi:MAG: MFS transporter [Bacteroidetes bacterium]|nr:MFS transporter [Bacteroidota bacterium]
MNYYNFFKANYGILLFGGILVFFSNFGQAFLLSLYIPSILESFEITRSEYSLLYSSATLLSAFTIIFAGKMIDRFDLKKFAFLVILGFATACMVAALSINIVMLFFAVFLLRFFGQGMLSHTAMTTMGRYFHLARGKALSISYLGFPIGEAILPLTIISVIAIAGWRETFMITAALVVLVLMPIAMIIISRFKPDDIIEQPSKDTTAKNEKINSKEGISNEKTFSQRDVLKSKYFIYFAPTVMLIGFTLTALFFFQTFIADFKGWPLELMAGGITGYASASIVFSIIAGPLIDKFTARKIFPFVLLPLASGIVVLSLFTHPIAPVFFWTLAGITAGIQSPVINALYAEVFGVKTLGSVRSLFTFVMVFSTALGPIVYSLLLDVGLSYNSIHYIIAGIIVLASASVFYFRK